MRDVKFVMGDQHTSKVRETMEWRDVKYVMGDQYTSTDVHNWVERCEIYLGGHYTSNEIYTMGWRDVEYVMGDHFKRDAYNQAERCEICHGYNQYMCIWISKCRVITKETYTMGWRDVEYVVGDHYTSREMHTIRQNDVKYVMGEM